MSRTPPLSTLTQVVVVFFTDISFFIPPKLSVLNNLMWCYMACVLGLIFSFCNTREIFFSLFFCFKKNSNFVWKWFFLVSRARIATQFDNEWTTARNRLWGVRCRSWLRRQLKVKRRDFWLDVRSRRLGWFTENEKFHFALLALLGSLLLFALSINCL